MWEIAVHLAVAGGVYDGVFLCCPFSHEMSWIRILDLIESVSEGFPTCSNIILVYRCIFSTEKPGN